MKRMRSCIMCAPMTTASIRGNLRSASINGKKEPSLGKVFSWGSAPIPAEDFALGTHQREASLWNPKVGLAILCDLC